MPRDISPEEARAEKLDELTAEHYVRLHRKLQGGNADLAHTIDDAISHQMDSAFWRAAVFDAVGPDGALVVGRRIKKLVEQALLAEAEVAALREIEQLERQREQSQDEAQIDRAVMDREARGAYWIVDEH
jgi:hypothetical protein